ncbi:MAG: hypothetical protein II721_03565 [Bacilli bacterium]|nr:hypothetical protein [Bacilli bacterium]
MESIKDEIQYKAIMARIDELFLETDEDTPADDARLQELDLLSALIEEYEKEHYAIEAASQSPRKTNLTPIEDLITEDFGPIGLPERNQLEMECDAFIIANNSKKSGSGPA